MFNIQGYAALGGTLSKASNVFLGLYMIQYPERLKKEFLESFPPEVKAYLQGLNRKPSTFAMALRMAVRNAEELPWDEFYRRPVRTID
jgi:hypothetical protein